MPCADNVPLTFWYPVIPLFSDLKNNDVCGPTLTVGTLPKSGRLFFYRLYNCIQYRIMCLVAVCCRWNLNYILITSMKSF